MMNIQEKRFLVTGSGGFVGRHLVNELKKEGGKVIGIDIQSGVDIRDWEKVKDIEDVDIVYHLAAIMYVPFSWERPQIVYEVNVQGTLNILEYCRIHDVKKMVFASSYLYGKPTYLPIDEKYPINPHNPYARSKKIAEDLCQGYSEDFGLHCIVLRPFNIYGPWQSEKFLIPTIINQIIRGKVELDDPKPKRDFLYIRDAVAAYINAGEYKGSDFEIFNIGSGISYSVEEVVRKLIDLFGKNVVVNYRNKRRKNEIMDTIADISKAKEKLKWDPKTILDDGLRDTISVMTGEKDFAETIEAV
jgi:nucleoside-diphosphate-sugar epimerase